MSEPEPNSIVAPRWIVQPDGRVEEFDPSQLAADLYRARCTHRREGAALFAAELSTAVMHFAQQEFASPVWRAERLKSLAANLLQKLGHEDTAEAWLEHHREQLEVPQALTYSPDLVGLVEEGVLDFDLRIADARLSLSVVDAIDFAGTSRSAGELLEGLRPALADAASIGERILVSSACIAAALLHDGEETPREVASRLVSIVVETIAATLTPIAVDLRWNGDFIERLSGGPLFPFEAPLDWEAFHRAVVDAIPKQVADRSAPQIPLCFIAPISRKSPSGVSHADWRSYGADRRATLLIGLPSSAIEAQRPVEIAVQFPESRERTELGSKEIGILSSAIRAAAQRIVLLRRKGVLSTDAQDGAVVIVVGHHLPLVQNDSRRRLEEFAKPFGISLRFVPPCRVWWGDEVRKFCLNLSYTSALAPGLWYLPSVKGLSSYLLIPRRDES